MPLSTMELAEARQAVAELLEQAGLDAFLFEVEPREDHWELRLECAVPDGWQSLVLSVDRDSLLASRNDDEARRRLIESWQEQWACKVAKD
jgi:hypothetical protein